ncbi:MAG: ABC transporter substrate-binding protein [Rhodospirillaceae bacterium]
MTQVRLLQLLAVTLCVSAQTVTAAEVPRRIVSTNLCTDQMVLLLAEPGTVASVSFLTADPHESPVAHLTDGLVLNHGQAEEIITLEPDVVVAGRYTTTAAKVLLRRIGYTIIEIDIPPNFSGVREAYLELGAVLGRDAQARALVNSLERRFTQLEQRVAGRSFGSVLILDANGFTVGRPSLIDQLLSRIGLVNVAAQLGIGDFGQVTMEAVLLAKPDHMVRMLYRPDAPSLANQTLNHPALVRFLGDQPMISVPQSWVNCGGPYLADAASLVLDAVDRRRTP